MLDFKPLIIGQRNHVISREFQSLSERGKKLYRHPLTPRNGDRKIMQSIRITSRPPPGIMNLNQFSEFR